jgi:hypothetical protein
VNRHKDRQTCGAKTGMVFERIDALTKMVRRGSHISPQYATDRHGMPGLKTGPKPLAKSLSTNLETHSTSEQSVSLGNGSDGKDAVRSECRCVTHRITHMGNPKGCRRTAGQNWMEVSECNRTMKRQQWGTRNRCPRTHGTWKRISSR